MKKKITYPTIITEKAVSIFKDGNHLVMSVAEPNFTKVIERIKAGNYKNIEELFDFRSSVEKAFGFKIHGNKIYWNGRRVHNGLTTRILDLRMRNLPMDNLKQFFIKLQGNPCPVARETLYDYCEKNLITIDSEGYFYLVKAVTSDLKDKWTGKISNHVGANVKMPREQVSKDPNECAGAGLHGGNSQYVGWYGIESDGDRYVMIRVHPVNVVVVPKDADKIRVCEYDVFAEVSRDALAFKSPILDDNIQASNIPPSMKPIKRMVVKEIPSNKYHSPYAHRGWQKQVRGPGGKFGPKN